MGRKKLDPNEKRKIRGFSLREEELNDLKMIAENLGINQSEVIRYFIQEAKKNQTWRNILRNLYEVDRKNKALEAYNKKHPWEDTNYETKTTSFTTYQATEASKQDRIKVNEQEYYNWEQAKLKSVYLAEKKLFPKETGTFEEWKNEKGYA